MPYIVTEGTPSHVGTFLANYHALGVLVELYEEIESTNSKRAKEKSQLSALLNSAVVMMVASWEAYIEDLARNAYGALITKAKSPRDFPNNVMALIARQVKEDRHELSPFDLAADGWRNVFEKYRDQVLAKYIGKFNTPKVENINALFHDLIGLEDAKESWTWENYNPKDILKALDDMVADRCDIAHRATCNSEMTLEKVNFYTLTVFHVSAIMSNRVAEHVKKYTGESPWTIVRYGRAE